MRITINVGAERLEKLRQIARHRGKRTASIVLQAIDGYLKAEEERKAAALRVQGSLSDREAAQMRKIIRELRGSWR